MSDVFNLELLITRRADTGFPFQSSFWVSLGYQIFFLDSIFLNSLDGARIRLCLQSKNSAELSRWDLSRCVTSILKQRKNSKLFLTCKNVKYIFDLLSFLFVWLENGTSILQIHKSADVETKTFLSTLTFFKSQKSLNFCELVQIYPFDPLDVVHKMFVKFS